MKTMMAMMTGHTVRFERHDLGNGLTLVCPHGGDRFAYAVQLSDSRNLLSGPQLIGRRKAAGLLARARRCGACSGTGAYMGPEPEKDGNVFCRSCDGTGRAKLRRAS